MKRPQLLRLMTRLEHQILATADDVRCYRLPANGSTVSLGRQYFPKNVMLFVKGVNTLLQ